MFKYYILTSGSLNCLARHFDLLTRNEVVVVINTTDKESETRTAEWCTKNSIEHYITKSDGTPATGKNSVIDLFLESDNEYMVQLDGDDIITPYGRNFYRTIAVNDNPPDILALSDQLSLMRYDNTIFKNQVDSSTIIRNFIPDKKYGPEQPWSRGYVFKDTDTEEIHKIMTNSYHIEDSERALLLAKLRIEVDQYRKDFGEPRDTFNRIVFYSRKGASVTAFDPKLKIGEDSLQYYKLKKLSYDGIIDMKLYTEALGRTYIYMEDTDGVLSKNWNVLSKEEKESHSSTMWGWLIPFMSELNRVRPYMSKDYRLEYITEPKYEINKQ